MVEIKQTCLNRGRKMRSAQRYTARLNEIHRNKKGNVVCAIETCDCLLKARG